MKAPDSEVFDYAARHIDEGATYDMLIASFRRAILSAALDRSRGNQCTASALLGFHRNTMARLCEQTGVDPTQFKRSRKKPPVSQVPATFQEAASQ